MSGSDFDDGEIQLTLCFQNNIFVTDLYSDTTQLVTTASSGTQANAYSRSPVISADGSRIIFQTLANNLVTLNVDPNDFGRTASILYKNTIGDSQAPASVTVPADNCQYYNAAIYQGWGWDPVTRQSCPPLNQ